MDESHDEDVAKVIGMGASSILTTAAAACPPLAIGLGVIVAIGAVYCIVEGSKNQNDEKQP